MDSKIVTVFGSSHAEPLGELHRTAFELGRTIAELGFTLCNGGYGGTMAAAAEGAVEAGGHTIGVTCTRFRRAGPNPHIRQEIPTFDLFHRLNTLIQLGRAYVVLRGGTGTLVEFALVWELLNKGLLRAARPVIVLGDSWQPVIDCVVREQPEAAELHVVPNVSGAREVLAELAD